MRELAPWGVGAVMALASGGLALWIHAETGRIALALLAHAAGCIGALLAARSLHGSDAADLETLTPVVEALAAGDSDAQLEVDPRSPLAALSAPLSQVGAEIARHRALVIELAEKVHGLPDQLAAAVSEAERGAEDQEGAIEETASLLANINTSIRGISSEVEGLARSNEETAASIQEMGTAIEQVAQGAVALQQTVESSTASIHQMGTSIRRVAESSEEVQQVADETATATTEMDRAIQEVGEHVRGASELTRKVSERAEEGSTAVGATIHGIEAISVQTREAKGALEELAGRIGEIGEIATVIGGISAETNLLSLNAAIIAAQAGEHGKAFAVVADQVKTLSQRTNTSAKQIEEMIRGVQTESANAVQAMAGGIDAVEEGVARSRVAGEALEVIRASASEASGQVAEISRATEEQARNSKHVASAAQKVSEHVQQISYAMSEQSNASESLARNVNTYLEMCRQMAQAMDEQRASGRYITGNSQAITEMISSIQENTAAHERASAAVAARFDALLEHAHASTEQIPRIAQIVEGLRREVDAGVRDGDEAEAST